MLPIKKTSRKVPCAFATIALLLVALPGCGLSKSPSSNPQPLTSSAGGDIDFTDSVGGREGFRRTVYEHARTHCVACHGVSQRPPFAVQSLDDAYAAAMEVVNFVEIPASRFVQKIKDSHCGGACSTDGSAMIKMIEEWKQAYRKKSASSTEPLEVLPGSTIPKGNIFTNAITVPMPQPARCTLPIDLRCSPDITSTTPTSCQNRCWTKLRFPAKSMTPAPPAELSRAWFEVDFAYENYNTELGLASYVIRNPRLVSPDASIFIHDVKFFLNGQYREEYGQAYRMVDTVVETALFGTGCTIPASPTAFDPNSIGNSCIPDVQPLFSSAASAAGIVQEKQPTAAGPQDTIAFSFEYFQKGIAGDCKDEAHFDQAVFRPIKIGAVACLTCHKSGGQINEAAQRFNMDPDDLANGATPAQRLTTICRKFLQRSNFVLPDNSPIIVQPRQGLNGMPPQDNFNFFAPEWIGWVQREAGLAGK